MRVLPPALWTDEMIGPARVQERSPSLHESRIRFFARALFVGLSNDRRFFVVPVLCIVFVFVESFAPNARIVERPGPPRKRRVA
jgi:hypothetical protein